MNREKFLRLTKADGSWIENPGLMLLAATTSANPVDIKHAYLMMSAASLLDDGSSSDALFSTPQEAFHNKVILGQKSERLTAGAIPVHIEKIHKASGSIPSINNAIRAHAELMMKAKPTRRPENTFENVKGCFSPSRFRPISHFLALLVCRPDLFVTGEEDPAHMDKAFAIALGWEQYLSEVFEAKHALWEPIHRPRVVAPIHPLDYIDELEVMAPFAAK